jgi:hypothetical protein
MYTSVVLLALLSIPGDVAAVPNWQRDYAVAQKLSESAKKPLVVILAPGTEGYDKLAREGGFSTEIRQTLAEKYICVHINTAQAAGKSLAAAFEMPGGLGIVISDRTGAKQAFRHEGDLAKRDLARYLDKYGDPDRVTTHTESNPGDERPIRASTSFENCST